MTYTADPELAAIEHLLPKADMTDLLAVRELERQVTQGQHYESERELTVTDVTIPGLGDNPAVPARVFAAAESSGPLPGLIYLRPSGYVIGSLATVEAQARAIADKVDVAVVTVDYRLAPEHPYPAALDDGYAVLCWATSADADRAIDPGRVAVIGDSAGGGLAAAIAMRARDDNGPAITALFLDAPTIDDRLETASMKAFPDTPMWRGVDTPVIWDHYLGNLRRGGDDVPRYAAPARATVQDLTGLPPTWITTYQLDPTRDEVLSFAGRLMQAGVPTELHSYSGAFHMTHLIPGTRIGARMIDNKHEAVRRMLAASD